MPGGDDDSIDSLPEDELMLKKKPINNGKFIALYDDAKHRNLRQ